MRALADWLLVFAPIGILFLIVPALIVLRFSKRSSRATMFAFSLLFLSFGAWFAAMTIDGLDEGRLGAGKTGWVTVSDGARYWFSAAVHIFGVCASIGFGIWALARAIIPSNSTVETHARESRARGSP